MAYENSTDREAGRSTNGGLNLLVALAIIAVAVAYFIGYLPQFDVLFSGAHAHLSAHKDQIFDILANAAPFVAVGGSALFLRLVIRRVTAQHRHA